VQIAILGPVEVHDEGRQLDVAGTRVRRLLTRLAVDAGRVVSVDELALAVCLTTRRPTSRTPCRRWCRG
jgi:DNA-binding SARP family transcriptional activator